MDKAASGAPAHVGRVSFGGCVRRSAGSRPTQRPRPGRRWAVARRTPFASSRRAHAGLRQKCGRIAGELHERPPSGAPCGGSAAQPGHQGGLAAVHAQILPARGSGAPVMVLHSACACALQPSLTTLTNAVSRAAALHDRSIGRQHRHHHLRHRGRCRGRGPGSRIDDSFLSASSVASAGGFRRL